ncbi:response regulator [Catenovulum sp. SM1970]|uniref:response regulator n=1 Tax=Marinifaba aquimaris TaxID=2741323 RepID=UPI001571BA0C|nr:response regulator [Marinifaba aquimaris]NTS76087.1 response regulator [Marinifaba aquimaris]
MNQPKARLSDIRKYGAMSALVVDDIESMCKAITQMLSLLGFKNVYQAKDGKDALRIMQDVRVDLIVSDWNMPKMTGFELLQSIRRKELRSNHIPFIMVTGNLEQDHVVKAISSGVSEYLVKPFSQQMLKERVKRAFQNPAPGLKREALEERYSSTQVKETQAVELPEKIKTILLVDDEPDNLHVLAGLLKKYYKIKACRSGQAAIDICLGKSPPDLILLDIMMPGMNGLQVCKALKNNPKSEHIPIIFVSALAETKDVVRGLELGAVDYITKPITPAIVLARVKTHMRLIDQQIAMTNQVDTLLENLKLQEEMERIFQHDLKNPLMAIMSASTTLERNTTYKTKASVEMVKESAELMTQMIDNILTLYQLETGLYQLEAKPVAVYDLITRVVDGFKDLSQQKDIKVRTVLAQNDHFLGEYLLSYTMFANLVKNAIEAAPRGTEVMITSRANDSRLIISIVNQGVIHIAIRTRFFEKFVSHGKKNGNGIGTYSAKLTAQAQGGDIEFETSEEEGTEIMVELERISQEQEDNLLL